MRFSVTGWRPNPVSLETPKSRLTECADAARGMADVNVLLIFRRAVFLTVGLVAAWLAMASTYHFVICTSEPGRYAGDSGCLVKAAIFGMSDTMPFSIVIKTR